MPDNHSGTTTLIVTRNICFLIIQVKFTSPKAQVPRRALSARAIAGFTLCAGLLASELDGTTRPDGPIVQRAGWTWMLSPNNQSPRRPADGDRSESVNSSGSDRSPTCWIDHQSCVKSPTCARSLLAPRKPPPPAAVASPATSPRGAKPLPRRHDTDAPRLQWRPARRDAQAGFN